MQPLTEHPRAIAADDSPFVLKMRIAQLKRLGYGVLPAESRAQALAHYLSAPDSISRIVTDNDMEHPDAGLSLAETVRGMGGRVPIVMVTDGDTNRLGAALDALGGENRIFGKHEGAAMMDMLREAVARDRAALPRSAVSLPRDIQKRPQVLPNAIHTPPQRSAPLPYTRRTEPETGRTP